MPGRPLESFAGDTLNVRELAAWRGCSVKAIYQQHAAGAWVFAEVKPRIGALCWDKHRLGLWARGELHGFVGSKPRLRSVS